MKSYNGWDENSINLRSENRQVHSAQNIDERELIGPLDAAPNGQS